MLPACEAAIELPMQRHRALRLALTRGLGRRLDPSLSALPRPHGPRFFHFEFAFAGQISQMIGPRTVSSRPNASPSFSP